MLTMPFLETQRLIIRPFFIDDLDDAYRLFDLELDSAELHTEASGTRLERMEFMQWATRNPEQLARLYQPPYGDRAIVLKTSGQLIGSCGYVPALAPFEQIPYFADSSALSVPARSTPEFALFYAIAPAHRRQGYAVEAARALVDYAFQHLNLKRVIAETDYTNLASQAVMRKLDMHLERNPLPEPPWLQVVGVLEFVRDV
jgi:RimJ/RimL family protein N-acetyltransferase